MGFYSRDMNVIKENDLKIKIKIGTWNIVLNVISQCLCICMSLKCFEGIMYTVIHFSSFLKRLDNPIQQTAESVFNRTKKRNLSITQTLTKLSPQRTIWCIIITANVYNCTRSSKDHLKHFKGYSRSQIYTLLSQKSTDFPVFRWQT